MENKENKKIEKHKAIYKFEINTWKETPYKVILAVFIMIFSYAFLFYFGNTFYAILGIVLPFFSFTEIFFPIKYYIYEDFIIIDKYFFKIKKEYTYYRKVYKDKNGLFLSPYRFPTRMENFRGILIRIPTDKRLEVFTFFKNKFEIKNNI